jgi:glycosyltransferase involved in cell wall biosynthesis
VGIPEVEPFSPDSRILGWSVDVCSLDEQCCGRQMEIAGWLLGAQPAVAVEVFLGDDVVARYAIDQDRPDVQASFPDSLGSGTSGYRGRMGLLAFPDSGLRLAAVLADQARVPFARILLDRPQSEPLAPEPLVSVIIPCYRQAHFLADSIGSVLRQTHPGVEVVVIDDGSPDNTEAVVRQYPGVRYLRQKNAGVSAARNAGIRASRGGYVMFLDADDRLLPDAVSRGLQRFHEDSGLGMVAGHFRVIGFDGRVIASPSSRAVHHDHYLSLLHDYFIGPPGVMLFRREVVEQLGGFDAANNAAADYEIVLRVARTFPIQVHEDVVLEYRRYAGSMSANPGAMLAATMAVVRQQRPHVKGITGGREAYRAAVGHWRRAWGEPLIERAWSDISSRRAARAVADLAALIRYHPRGAGHVARRLAGPPELVSGR